MSDVMLVRICPFNPRQGKLVKSYTFRGVKFKEDAGWYKVEPGFAAELVDIYQVDGDEMSGAVFEVRDPAEAVKVEEREKAAKERASARNPARMPESSHKPDKRRTVQGVMTTADLTAPRVEVVGNVLPATVTVQVEAADDNWDEDLAEDNEAPKAEPELAAVVADTAKVEDEAPKPARLGPPIRLGKK